jgi:hypothetical protein
MSPATALSRPIMPRSDAGDAPPDPDGAVEPRITELIDRIAASAPPLSDHQRNRLVNLFLGTR